MEELKEVRGQLEELQDKGIRSAADSNAYVKECKALALYDTGVTAIYGDKLISLSTCEYSALNGRLVVAAKKVTE